MIRKIPTGYRVVTESGKNLGKYDTEEEAEEREIEVINKFKKGNILNK